MEKNLTEEEIRAIIRDEIEKANLLSKTLTMTPDSFKKALLDVVNDTNRIKSDS